MNPSGFQFQFSGEPMVPAKSFTKLKPVYFNTTDKTYYVYVDGNWRSVTPEELSEIEAGRELS